MSPKFWEKRAQQLYPHRKWLAVGTAVGILMFIGGGFFISSAPAPFVSALGLSTAAISWGLFCVAYWFEPSKGSLRHDTWLGRHLGALNIVARWWAAIFAAIFLIAGVVGPAWWVVGAARAA
jgi:hypothetical protein